MDCSRVEKSLGHPLALPQPLLPPPPLSLSILRREARGRQRTYVAWGPSVAVCCSVVQRVAESCRELQRVAKCYRVLQRVAVRAWRRSDSNKRGLSRVWLILCDYVFE